VIDFGRAILIIVETAVEFERSFPVKNKKLQRTSGVKSSRSRFALVPQIMGTDIGYRQRV